MLRGVSHWFDFFICTIAEIHKGDQKAKKYTLVVACLYTSVPCLILVYKIIKYGVMSIFRKIASHHHYADCGVGCSCGTFNKRCIQCFQHQ